MDLENKEEMAVVEETKADAVETTTEEAPAEEKTSETEEK